VGVVFRPQLPPERLHDFVVSAEAAGLDDVWLWEDCFFEGSMATAGAALAWTASARIGVGLMPVPFRNPVLAAMEVATLARMFPGRFVPAAGHGVLAWMDQVGAGVRSPMTLLREWVTAVRSLLNGETVTVSGQYVRLDDVALDWPPQAVPPLLVGARGPRTVTLAGEIADGLVLDAAITPDGVRRAVVMAATARPQEVVVYLLCAAGPDARGRVEAELAAAPQQPANPSRGAPAECTAVGSAADVARIIGAYGRAGATTVVLQPTADEPDIAETIRLAGQARTALRAGR
jgi:alkanesulfonate monooxygenase SsuD/methylene tetrahydromethanopterin reductase-like flavin-dependent oxidoreductase (luciferase family)